MADSDLNILLNAVDKASGPIQSVARSLSQLEQAQKGFTQGSSGLMVPQRYQETVNQINRVKTAYTNMGAAVQDVSRQFSRSLAEMGAGLSGSQAAMVSAATATQSFGQRVSGSVQNMHDFGQSIQSAGQSLALGFTVPLVATGAVLATFDQNAAKLQAGTAFEGVAKQFGVSADEIIQSVKEASGQTITSLDAAAAASRAMVYGVGSNAEELGELMMIARDRARVFGLTTTQAFNDLTLGIGRQSRLILDNLGIIVKVESANEAYAASLGKSADDLDINEQRQAFLNAVLEQTRSTMDKSTLATRNASEEYAHQRAQLDELTQQFQAFVLPILNKVLGAFNALPESAKLVAVGFLALTLVLGPLLSALGAIIKLNANVIATLLRLAGVHTQAAAAAEAQAVAEGHLATSLGAVDAASAGGGAGASRGLLGLAGGAAAAVAGLAALTVGLAVMDKQAEGGKTKLEGLAAAMEKIGQQQGHGMTLPQVQSQQIEQFNTAIAKIKELNTALQNSNAGGQFRSNLDSVKKSLSDLGAAIQASSLTAAQGQTMYDMLLRTFPNLESVLGPVKDAVDALSAAEAANASTSSAVAQENLNLAQTYKDLASSLSDSFSAYNALNSLLGQISGLTTREELEQQKIIELQNLAIANRELELNQFGQQADAQSQSVTAMEAESDALGKQISALDIAIKERELYAKSLVPKELLQAIKALEAQIPPIQREINQRQRAINVLQREMNERQRVINSLDRERNAIQRQITDIERQARAIERSNKPLERQVNLMDILARKTNLAAQPARNRLAALEKMPGVSQQVIDAAQAEVDAFDMQLQEMENSQEAIQIEIDLRQMQADMINESADALRDEAEALQDQIDVLNDQNSAIQDEISVMEDANGVLADQIQAIQDDIDVRNEFIDTLVPPELQEEIDKLKQHRDELDLQKQKLDLIIPTRNQIKANTGDTFDPLINSAQAAKDRAQTVLDRLNAIKNLGVLQVKIDAGLAPNMQQILVLMAALQKGPETFQQALGLLKNPNFMNLAGSKGMSIWQAINEALGLGLALPKFAAGGLVTRPTVGLIGEAGPEMVMPLSAMGKMTGGTTVIIENMWGSDNRAIDQLATEVSNRLRRKYRG